MRDAKFISDLAQVTFHSAFVLHHRSATDNFQVRDPGQIGQNFILHTIGEERVFRIGAEILEWQNSQQDSPTRVPHAFSRTLFDRAHKAIAALGDRLDVSALVRRLAEGLADGLDGGLVHLNHRDVTLICFSRAPIDRLVAYKQRMGWRFPYVSTYETDFPFDFGLAMTEEQAQQVPEVKEMIDNPPDWLEEWSRQIGAELKDGLREGPSWIAFARENGTVYHTYTVMAPDPFVAPYYSFLLDRTPKAQPEEPRAWRKDEYPD